MQDAVKKFLQSDITYQDFLQKVADITPGLITVYNIKTGQYIFVNKAITSMLGYQPSQWLEDGMKFVGSLVHPDDIEKIAKENNAALEKANKQKYGKNPIVHFEYRVKHKNGKWKWFHTYGTVFDRDEKGQVLHVLNVSLDITARKEIETQINKKETQLKKLNAQLEDTIQERTKALTESESRLNEAQRISHMGSWEYDLSTGQIIWSDGIFRIHGLDRKYGEPDYKTFLSFFPDKELIKTSVNKAITKGIPYQFDTSVTRHDKTIRYIQAIGRPIKDSSGKVIKLYGTAIDITDRKLAELRRSILLEAGRRLASSLDYETTFENIIKSTVPNLADWCILDLKRGEKYERVLVVHHDKSKAKYAKILKDKFPPNPDTIGGVGRVLKSGTAEFRTSVTPEIALQTARNDPELLALLHKMGLESFMILPLVTRNNVQGAVTFVSSNPGRRYVKDDLIMATQLSWRIAVAIDNARLYREAQNAVRVREEFISIASHELKTPVTSMKMYSQILERMIERKSLPDLLPYTKKINDQIDKQTKLIADLLDVSKLELGKLDFNFEAIKIQDLVEEVAESIRLLYPKYAIVIEGTATKPIQGDRDRLSQVLVNLLTNAVKYSPKSDKVNIKLSQTSENIRVSVIDYGIGIAKENQEKIFNRFFQVQEPLIRTYPGLGIGLYISSQIIKRHSGEIHVISQKNKGSAFSFTLPIK